MMAVSRSNRKSDEHLYLLALLKAYHIEHSMSLEDPKYISFISPTRQEIVIEKLGFIPSLRFLVDNKDNKYQVDRDKMAAQFANDKMNFLVHLYCYSLCDLANNHYSGNFSALITTFINLRTSNETLASYNVFQIYSDATDVSYAGIEHASMCPMDSPGPLTPAFATKLGFDQNQFAPEEYKRACERNHERKKRESTHINPHWVYYHVHSIEKIAQLNSQEMQSKERKKKEILALLNQHLLPPLSDIVMEYTENYLRLLRQYIQALPYDPELAPFDPLLGQRIDPTKENIRSINVTQVIETTQIITADLLQAPERYSFFHSTNSVATTTTTTPSNSL